MPIKIPNKLPAVKTLESENIFVMTEKRALKQDIRPLKILLVNLMPTKIETETQFSRLLGNTPLHIELTLLHTKTHKAKNVSEEHLINFYKTFDEIKNQKFDGMVVTGAPVEKLEFEEVEYWQELCEIMDWSRENVYSSLYVCWGAQAGLYHLHGLNKYPLEHKLFGVFKHTISRKNIPLFRGFDDTFYAPHSRHTTIKREEVEQDKTLKILASSEQAGVYAISSNKGRQIFITGHPEYDPDTLAKEYFRDKNLGLPIKPPENYYPDNDDTKPPIVRWRAHASLLYSNWLNYYVYQATPYDVDSITL